MLKMLIPASVLSVKVAKDGKSHNYADFLFVGGIASLPIDQSVLEALKPLEGSEVLVSFQMRPLQIVRFNRSVTVFEPVKVLEVVTA